MSELIGLIQGYNRALESGIKCGRDVTTQEWHRRVRGLALAYQKAVLDPKAQIPTYLEATIAALVVELPDYVDTMIRKERLERHEGRADHDQDTRGNQAKAGS